MQIEEYLKTQRDLNTTTFASKMWPNNKSAFTYLSNKLSGKRPWTQKDEDNARKVLNELGAKLQSL